MTDITWEGDIKLAVINTDVEGRQKCKIQNEQLTWDLTKKFRNMKIREQIKDWKNIHAERVTVEKLKKKKREKKNQKMWTGKEKKWKKTKKKQGQYEHFLFFISVTFRFGTDACFLLYYFVEIVLLKILLLSSTWGGAAQ